jgi:hypothetical protein
MLLSLTISLSFGKCMDQNSKNFSQKFLHQVRISESHFIFEPNQNAIPQSNIAFFFILTYFKITAFCNH